MSDTYRVYQYDYTGYYTGHYLDVPNEEGYSAGPWTVVPVPSIPEGQYAVFDGNNWFLTASERPLPPDETPVQEKPAPVSKAPVVL